MGARPCCRFDLFSDQISAGYFLQNIKWVGLAGIGICAKSFFKSEPITAMKLFALHQFLYLIAKAFEIILARR